MDGPVLRFSPDFGVVFLLVDFTRLDPLPDLLEFWPGTETKWEIWLLRTWFGMAMVNKLVSLTWLLWVLRSFQGFTLHYIEYGQGRSIEQLVNKLVSLTWLLWALRSFQGFTLHYMRSLVLMHWHLKNCGWELTFYKAAFQEKTRQMCSQDESVK